MVENEKQIKIPHRAKIMPNQTKTKQTKKPLKIQPKKKIQTKTTNQTNKPQNLHIILEAG